MAFDKAVDSAQLDAGLTTIANAIRAKGGTTEPLEFPQGMADAVAAIPSGGSDPDIIPIIERTITALNRPDITKVGNYAFYGCKKLKTVELPNAVELGEYSCRDTGITTVNAPKATFVGAQAFFNISSLETITLADACAVETNCFYSCKSLSSVNSVLGELSGSAFRGCSNLQRLETTTSGLFGAALKDCSKLDTLILRRESLAALQSTDGLTGTLIASGTGYIYVPKALVEEYKAATNWVTYADQIRAIEDYPEITGGTV